MPSVKRQIIDLAVNGSGIRDTARVLGISTDTVISELKKKECALESVNKARLAQPNADDRKVVIQRVEAAEVDAIWSYVGKKTAPQWLWHAIDHYRVQSSRMRLADAKTQWYGSYSSSCLRLGLRVFTRTTGARMRGN
jgi:InsA C-terminal domain